MDKHQRKKNYMLGLAKPANPCLWVFQGSDNASDPYWRMGSNLVPRPLGLARTPSQVPAVISKDTKSRKSLSRQYKYIYRGALGHRSARNVPHTGGFPETMARRSVRRCYPPYHVKSSRSGYRRARRVGVVAGCP